MTNEEGLAVIDAERKVFGATHPEVGAYLLGLWGLPNSIVEAVAFHHSPSHCAAESFSPLTAVHVADYLVDESSRAVSNEPAGEALDSIYVARLALEGRMNSWRALKEIENG